MSAGAMAPISKRNCIALDISNHGHDPIDPPWAGWLDHYPISPADPLLCTWPTPGGQVGQGPPALWSWR